MDLQNSQYLVDCSDYACELTGVSSAVSGHQANGLSNKSPGIAGYFETTADRLKCLKDFLNQKIRG